jgi:hypothetical protein
MGGRRRKKKGVVEGFRVLTLLYRVSELLANAFQRLVVSRRCISGRSV